MSINPETIFKEVASGKLTLICGKHRYIAARKRANGVVIVPPEPNGCKFCWENYYITDMALTPPEKRQERLDELEAVVHHAIEFEKTGKFGADFELFNPTQDARFEVAVQTDAADDETGADKIVNPEEEKLN